MYAGDYRFYSEEQRNELRDFAYDDLHKAKASGNMDALLLYASVSKNRKQKVGALYESAKAGNDIAAYNYWVIIFRRYRYASREVMDKFSKENIVTGNQEYIKTGNEATSKIATIVHQKR